MKTKRIKAPYLLHILVDSMGTFLIYHFLGFEITVLWVLLNINVDIVKGFEGYFR